MCPSAAPSAAPPFRLPHQLSPELDGSSASVLGYPCLSLEDHKELWEFLDRDLWAHGLDRIADRLWWMSKQDSGNISPLHRQSVKRRTIFVTEDPKLRLVWIYDRIFIKPLPRYIGSHAFWRDYLNSTDGDGPQARIRRAALGYVRTHRHLVRYESEFRIAQDPHLCLIPADVTWE
ncbi:hypothetical protein CDD83_7907 [Cordyceps sp. RAO-2017]|nr:hypothetical protein CDD83_7907 [Cordyceps sp. RAO-2017]